ncbi:hypothetical protein, partial [Mesorhizobium sp.]|uniref:hypothetical protein n=1 Tax=Mesorhizobium sp. TaxID=1871066 RepID=UPI0025D43600
SHLAAFSGCSVSSKTKKRVSSSSFMALSANPFANRKGNALADGGMLVPEWVIERRYGVGFDFTA